MCELCGRLHQLFDRQAVLGFPFDDAAIPLNGIYVLFEQGEFAHGTRRIVRVGTHTGKNQLRARLRQHFIKESKDRSIFRKNIGRALLHRDDDPFLTQWELDLTTTRAKQQFGPSVDHERQSAIERRVTGIIQKEFQFAVVRLDDKARRLDLESKMISTVSLCKDCGPSVQWLGLHSPKAKIRESGLWLVNELYKEPLSEGDFRVLEDALARSSIQPEL